MINWDNFGGFLTTGIPLSVLYTSLILSGIIIGVCILSKNVCNKRRAVLWVLLIEYLFIVVCSTIVCRGPMSFGFDRLEITPFWTYEAVMNHTPGVSVWDIVLNVVLFVPLGFLVKLLFPRLRLWKMIMLAICCSVLIETNQYFFEKGIAQIDDVMHNTIGAGIGWFFARGIISFSVNNKNTTI